MSPRSRQRNVFEHFRRPLVPELRYLGRDLHEATISALRPHVHRRAYELCLITAGSVEWWVGDEVHQVDAGQWFITRPGEEHGGVDSMMHRCELYFLQIALPLDGRVAGMSRPQGRAVAQAFAKLRRRRFAASPRAQAWMEAIIQEHRQPGPMASTMVRGALHQVLAQVLRDHDAAQDAERAPSPTMLAAMRWMQDRLGEDFRVGDVAAAVGLSVNHFQIRFRREVGLTPADYRARQRVRRAQMLLRRGDVSITRLAMDLGFGSSQYFATTFRRIVGMSPRDYRSRWQAGERGEAAGGEGSGVLRLPKK